MPDETRCRSCGCERPARAPDGLCPRCLMRQALAPDSAGAASRIAPDSAGSVLEALARTADPLPRVLLTELEPAPEADSIVRPGSAEVPAPGQGPGRYQLFGEIARGGMGAVLKGRDPDLGRELAVKVLLEKHREAPELVRRFVEEAQIAGQLQHPGIVPVYDLGLFPDRRPFFTMKLVKGRTLAGLLDRRASPGEDLPRYLAIFEAVCQTVAYAHARGVIHRDLKPSNVMVGAFGEVQVMDWGLAKVLPKGGAADDATAGRLNAEETVIATARSGSDSDLSQAGSVMGTPSYMAPEQARGEVDRMDERADVFALGSILCEILTGQPTFTGRSSGEIQRRAAAGDRADALARLDASRADTELIALARDCLAPEPEGRPRNAGAVAGRVSAYQAGVREKLRAAELAQVEAQARADEERKRRKLTVTLAASILLLFGVGGLGALAYQRQINQETGRVEVAHGQAVQRLGSAREAWSGRQDPSGYDRAVEAVEAAEALLTARVPAGLSGRVRNLAEAARSEAAAAHADRALLDNLAAVRAGSFDLNFNAPGEYGSLFSDVGASLDGEGPDFSVLAATLRGHRPRPVVTILASFLDDWSLLLKRDRPSDRSPSDRVKQSDRVTALAQALDPDPWRNDLRATLGRSKEPERRTELSRLAAAPDAAAQKATTLTLLAAALIDVGEAAQAVALLEPARWRYRDDPWVFLLLGRALRAVSPPRRNDALRAFTAATTLNPALGLDLAIALADNGQTAEAITVMEDVIRHRADALCYYWLGEMQSELGRTAEAKASFARCVELSRRDVQRRPGDAWAHGALGYALAGAGDFHGAVAANREAIRLMPDHHLSHINLCLALREIGDLEAAVTAGRRAIQLRPDEPIGHFNLAFALSMTGDVAGAIESYREAIRLEPDNASTHSNLGIALKTAGDLDGAIAAYRRAIALKPDLAPAHCNLGDALTESGDLDSAVASCREAIRLKPDLAMAHINLGNALRESGDREGALAALRRAIELGPGLATAHSNLGLFLSESGDHAGALAAHREAVRLGPGDALVRSRLGQALSESGDNEGAVAAVRVAVKMQPDDAAIRFSLGNALKAAGDLNGAIAAYCRAIELKPLFAVAHSNLGNVLQAAGNLRGAVDAYRKAIALKPDFAIAHYNLGYALHESGDRDRAIAAYQKAIALKPNYADAHCNLGVVLLDAGDLRGAVAAFRKAIALKPDFAIAHYNLGNALHKSGDRDRAIAAYQKAIVLKPNYADAHCNLGVVLQEAGDPRGAVAAFHKAITLKPGAAMTHFILGNALHKSGDLRGAAAAFRTAIRLGPADPKPHFYLGETLRKLGDLRGAVNALRDGARLKPDDPVVHPLLGSLLDVLGEYDEAIAEYRKGIAITPGDAAAHNNLAYLLASIGGDLDEALTASREALRLKPESPDYLDTLGVILLERGQFEEALRPLREAKRRGAHPVFRTHLDRAERLAALAPRLPAVLAGHEKPVDAAERAGFAEAASLTGRPASAARLWLEALESDRKLGDDRQAQHRFHAARCAALAAAGQGQDAPASSGEGRDRLRRQAHAWLREELNAWSRALGREDARAQAAQAFRRWRWDPDLAGVRDPAALNRLPAPERRDWEALWAEVAALARRAEAAPTIPDTLPSLPFAPAT